MAPPRGGRPDPQGGAASGQTAAGLEIYRRLILLGNEFKAMAQDHDTLEGKTALTVAAHVIRSLASGFIGTLPATQLQPPAKEPQTRE